MSSFAINPFTTYGPYRGNPSSAKPMSGEWPSPSSTNGDFTYTRYLW